MPLGELSTMFEVIYAPISTCQIKVTSMPRGGIKSTKIELFFRRRRMATRLWPAIRCIPRQFPKFRERSDLRLAITPVSPYMTV